ncbi:MAG: hypothetical protein HKN05_03220 [Rhizobiales bacterium]|nr:hypothetical protein [Hyphomicrobiales bacterium]
MRVSRSGDLQNTPDLEQEIWQSSPVAGHAIRLNFIQCDVLGPRPVVLVTEGAVIATGRGESDASAWRGR